MQWQNRQNLRGERCKCTRPTLTPRIVFHGNFSARKITRVYLESRWGENVMPLVALTPTLPAVPSIPPRTQRITMLVHAPLLRC